MPRKDNLKDELERIEKDHVAELARLVNEKNAADRKKERAELAEAKLIVGGIPGRVKEMIGVSGSIELCSGSGDGVGRELNECGGLAAKIIALLEAEGLGDRVFVDIDMSGSWHSKDSLRFRNRKK